MTLSDAERRRAIEVGIALSHIGNDGVEHHPSSATVRAVLDVLDVPGVIDELDRAGTGSGRASGDSCSESARAGTGVELRRCHDRPFATTKPRHEWGVFSPLYGLRGNGDGGIGTVSALVEMGEWISTFGGSVISTLPLLDAFILDPYEPSPYRPMSRRFWNELFIEPSWVEGYVPDRRSGASITGTRVDHQSVARSLRDRLWSVALGENSAAFHEWLAADPEQMIRARFRAAGERHGVDWRVWPASWRTHIPDEAVDAELVRWYAWSQFEIQRQLGIAADRLRALDVVLAADLPVGTHPDGFDNWRHRELFVDSMSIGAPPDSFQQQGQNWGLAPLHPGLLATPAGQAYFSALIDHHLSVAGLLRIDHVMGLHRQWWIPEGAAPTDGVYVRFPSDLLWDLIAASSQRFGAGILGEDLGTVPDEVRTALVDRDVLGTFVAQSEHFPASTSLHRPPPTACVASLDTHDMEPFAAHWAEHGDPEISVTRARDELLAQLALSDAELVMVDLADLELVTEAHNRPGTVSNENWSLRSPRSITEMRADPALSATLVRIDSHRRHPQLVTDLDLHLFNEGTHSRLPERFGAHELVLDTAATTGRPGGSGPDSVAVADQATDGVVFSVWAPDARAVSVIGDAAGWDTGHPLAPVGASGVWAGVVGHARVGQRYKFRITGADGSVTDRADPLARAGEGSPDHASLIAGDDYRWSDAPWMEQRADRQRPDRPMSIYEVHLGSWRRHHAEDRPLTYREAAPYLATYASTHGFTHIEFLPLMEHPFTASWGYQVTGFFQPTARYGSADDLRFLIDHLHQYGIGVILDWVPAHFPADRFGLAAFDGTHLYEHADPREGRHPDWGSLIFNYSRNEVRSFLLSSACWWIESFHADGLRVDAVASMLYRDYSRAAGEWVPNVHGGRENLEAISLLRACNDEIHQRFPGVLVIAEESTSWPGVTAPTAHDGLGFDLKWDLGWMHDTLDHLRRDPVHRRWHHDELTFRQMYANSEHFLLALSHDEVVHGKGSLLSKMPGDDWQQRATLRLLFAYQHLMQGKKLVFMGGEFGQRREWNHDTQLDWELLEYEEHAQLLGWVTALNELHARCPALHQLDHDPAGFVWISCDDSVNSVVAMVRRGFDEADDLVAVCNFTPNPLEGYRIGMPHPGSWELLVSSDDMRFGGSGMRVPRVIEADGEPLHGFAQSAFVNAVPLGVVLYRRVR